MSAVAPPSIYKLWDDVSAAIPRAQLSGIVGDVAHSFGYHLARTDLPSNDYSVVLPADKLGSSANASALDVSLPPDLMITVTNRLLAAAKAKDPRLHALREFCGTTDGSHTHPYDLSNGQDGPLDSWDSSHLWHVHLSFYREYADNYAALAPIADVMAGTDSASGGLTMDAEVKARFDAIDKRLTSLFGVDANADGKADFTGTVQAAVHDEMAGAVKLLAVIAPKVAELQQDVTAIQSTLAGVAKTVASIPASVSAVTKAVAAIAAPTVTADVQAIVSGVSSVVTAKLNALTWKASA